MLRVQEKIEGGEIGLGGAWTGLLFENSLFPFCTLVWVHVKISYKVVIKTGSDPF